MPKDEEYKYQPLDKVEEVLMPRTVEFPPLMKELMLRRLKAKGERITEEPRLPVLYNNYGNKRYRVAEEGETPTAKITIALGVPASPSLYANVKPI